MLTNDSLANLNITAHLKVEKKEEKCYNLHKAFDSVFGRFKVKWQQTPQNLGLTVQLPLASFSWMPVINKPLSLSPPAGKWWLMPEFDSISSFI